MRHMIFALSAIAGCSAPALAQTKLTTDCVSYVAGQLTCTTKEDPSSAFARSLAAQRARTDRLARENARDAALLAQRQAEDKTLAAVFVPKALYAINAAVDTLGLSDVVERQFRTEARDVVSNVFVARPSASTAEIADALIPLSATYRARAAVFGAGVNRVLQSIIDSLQLSGDAYAHFLAAASPPLTWLRGRDLDASDEKIQLALDPAMSDTKAYLESHRASPKRRAKRPKVLAPVSAGAAVSEPANRTQRTPLP
jgi:hypothetical protein